MPFRSLFPFENPIGFGASDFIELGAAAVFVLFALARPWAEPVLARIARTAWVSMVLLAILPLALRLAVVGRHPAPSPATPDEFSRLLSADTLRHLRLANPVHPMHAFFETLEVLQQPSYVSVLPLGEGAVLAAGSAIFRHPWAGVLAASSVFCSLCYWMLRGWTTPGWALAGGMLALIPFGPFSVSMNSYSAAAGAACAGCLVLGGVPRVRDSVRVRDGVVLGVGIGVSFLFSLVAGSIWLVSSMWAVAAVLRRKTVLPAIAIPVLAALAIIVSHNYASSSNWTTPPVAVSQYQYGVPATLSVQANAVPHRPLTAEQAMAYRAESAIHGERAETAASYLRRLFDRLRYYRMLLLWPLYLALALVLTRLRESRYLWAASTAFAFALVTNLEPVFRLQQIAPVAGLLVLMSIGGLTALSRWRLGPAVARVVLYACFAVFAFRYGMFALEQQRVHGRSAVRSQLEQVPGTQVVFVRYGPRHRFMDEWVYNGADIDAERIVWARDLGGSDNQKAMQYYCDRAAWLLEPDEEPPKLSRYQIAPPTPETPKPAIPSGSKSTLRFEEVPDAK